MFFKQKFDFCWWLRQQQTLAKPSFRRISPLLYATWPSCVYAPGVQHQGSYTYNLYIYCIRFYVYVSIYTFYVYIIYILYIYLYLYSIYSYPSALITYIIYTFYAYCALPLLNSIKATLIYFNNLSCLKLYLFLL